MTKKTTTNIEQEIKEIKNYQDVMKVFGRLIGRDLTAEEVNYLDFLENDLELAKKYLNLRKDLKGFLSINEDGDSDDIQLFTEEEVDKVDWVKGSEEPLKKLQWFLRPLKLEENNYGGLNQDFIGAVEDFYEGDGTDDTSWFLKKINNKEYGNENITDFEECGNCGEFERLKSCSECRDLFCENCLENNECSDCRIATCSQCGEEGDRKQMLSCESCGEPCCDNEECYDYGLEKCIDCADREKEDWDICEGCEEKQPPKTMEECWRCRKEFCGDCLTERKIVDGKEEMFCHDCF